MRFTKAEINLMQICNPGTRDGLIAVLEELLCCLSHAEIELMDLTCSTLLKVRQISDAAFAALDLLPNGLKGW